MKIFLTLRKKSAQTAVEYMLLLAAVVAIVLIGFKYYLPEFTQTSNMYFNRVAEGIMGEPPLCGNGCCDWAVPLLGTAECTEGPTPPRRMGGGLV
jgi:hypothetical protein